MGSSQGKRASIGNTLLEGSGDAFHTVLPKEMILHILSFLDYKDLMVISSLGRCWKLLAENDTLWKGLCISFIQEKLERIEPFEKPEGQSWKGYFRLLPYYTFEDCGGSLQFSENKQTVQVCPTGVGGYIAQMAVGRLHTSGRHKYTIRINNNTYVGIGVASPRIGGTVLQGDALLHKTEGCSVYYYTGFWYGRKGDRNVFSQFEIFQEGDKINLYLDVDERVVKYFKGDSLLLSCKTHISHLEKGMKLAVVLGHNNSSVSIVGYSPVLQCPKEKKTERENKNKGGLYSNNTYI